MRFCAKAILTLSAVCLLVTAPQAGVFGQEFPQLVAKETTTVKGPIGPSAMFVTPVSCDPQGGVYFYVYKSNYITKVSTDGDIVQKFSIASVPGSYLKDPSKATILRYSVDQRGELYATVSDPGHGYLVVKFDSDGTFEDAFKLNIYGLFPDGLTPFPTGEILVTGVLETHLESGSPVPKPYTAIFDPYGELLAKPSPSGDVSVEAFKSKGKGKAGGQSAQTAASNELEAVVATGQIATGYDGNAYVFRNSPSPLVYVISADGKVVRTLVLKPPAKGLSPISESLSGARIAVAFGVTGPKEEGATERMTVPEFYCVYDALTGKRVAVYKAPPKLGAFACYNQNAFLFVNLEEGHLTLVKAEPQ